MADDERKRFLEGNEMELGELQGKFSPPRSPPAPKYTPAPSNWQNNPILPVIAYCASSIMMTVANKYILAFPGFNLNFFLLAIQARCSIPSAGLEINCWQAIVCIVAIQGCKAAGIITYRDFKTEEAKKCAFLHRYGILPAN
jgi:GDP-mannose transporter